MTEVSAGTASSSLQRWIPAWIAIAVLVAGAGVGFSSILAWIHGAWWSFIGVSAYSHGYIVLGLSLWMGYVRWTKAPPAELRPDWIACVPLVGALTVLAIAEWWGVNSSRALVLPLVLLASITFVFGRAAGYRLAIPAAFLYFGLLPWWMLRPMLQDIATYVVGAVLAFNGIPVFIDVSGHIIQIPAGTFRIVSACSGLSFLLSALTVATFYALMFLRHFSSRALLIAAAVAAAVVSNWVRIYALVLIGELTAMQHPLIEEHYLFGWALFIVALAPVLWLGLRLENHEASSSLQGQERMHTNGSAVTAHNGIRRPSVHGTILVAAALAGLLFLIPQVFRG